MKTRERENFQSRQAATTLSARLLRTFLRRRSGVAGAITILCIVLMALLAQWIAPYSPSAQDLASRLQTPSSRHLLGTDLYGRDVLSRIIYGTRASLAVGGIAVLIAAAVGTGLAGIALSSTIADTLLMRVVDILMVFPPLLLAIAFVAALGPGLPNIIAAVALATVPQFTRVVRAEGLEVRELIYVEAARAIGASRVRVIMSHIMRSVWPTIIVIATLQVSNAILLEATLSFFGLGIAPPTPSWGAMVSEGRAYLGFAPWLSLFPGLFILVTILALNLLGDGLRDALDPHLRGTTTGRD